MRKIILGIVLALAVILGYQFFASRNDANGRLIEESALIEKQIKSVGKLVVTEGSFAEVFSYKNSKKFYLDVLSARKKALIVVNAQVAISYDLRDLETRIDTAAKIIEITYIPPPEISINPNIEYYDVTQDYLNKFEASDYNTIKNRVDKLLREKIDKSNLRENASNRLVSELANIYILTNSLGWTLIYNGETIDQENQIKPLIPKDLKP